MPASRVGSHPLGVELGPHVAVQFRWTTTPLHGVTEDPATGSANAGLGNLLASLNQEKNATLQWDVAQGIEMGRPSRLHVTVERRDGAVAEVRVAGSAVIVCRGQIAIP